MSADRPDMSDGGTGVSRTRRLGASRRSRPPVALQLHVRVLTGAPHHSSLHYDRVESVVYDD